ncbi:DNA recombination protein RmuC [Marinobacteraceae bacterium S3BR75-40.1]
MTLQAQVERLESEREQWRNTAEERGSELSRLNADLVSREERLTEWREEGRQLQERLEESEREVHQLRSELRAGKVAMEEERKSLQEKLALLESNRDSLKQEFENLANKIFEQKSARFTEQNKTNLDGLLTPFREQMKDFRKRIDQVYDAESRDRRDLHAEIRGLKDLNQRITEEAANLTKALRGDKKIQGNWGELILEKVLERSGLRKGSEYETQGTYRDESRQIWRPDVVIHLPEERNVIIDSKVSLAAYQDYVTAEDELSRNQALKQHVDAVRAHIKSLSEKDYSQLEGLASPDFVLMFMPIEPAFVAAFQHDERLFNEAFDNKIVVVTPTTLLATLRTIENIWRYERQSQNARKIAQRAGLVYDKLRVFLEHMDKLGSQLQTVHGTYDQAMNTLSQGRGNLVSQAKQFERLGVRVRKELPRTMLENADLEPEDEEVVDEGIPQNANDSSTSSA